MASFAFRTIIKSVLSTLTVDNSGRLEQLGDIQVTVTKPKLVLLATQQTSKLRGKVLGQQIVTLFRKPQIQEDGGLMS